jgi:hypothetical protein
VIPPAAVHAGARELYRDALAYRRMELDDALGLSLRERGMAVAAFVLEVIASAEELGVTDEQGLSSSRSPHRR